MLFSSLTTASLLLLPTLVTSEFIDVSKQSIIQRNDVKLKRVEAMGIPNEGLASNFTEANMDVFSLSLDVDFFDTLSENQFDSLMETYSGWSKSPSLVTYKPGNHYSLIDFIPRIMQAVNGMRFQPQNMPVTLPAFSVTNGIEKSVEQNGNFLINCWGFAYDTMFSSQQEDHNSLTFTLGSPINAYTTFTDKKYFDQLQKSTDFPKDEYDDLRNTDLQPGDVLLIWHQNKGEPRYLDHIAVMLDDDVYFERAGTGEDVPFRVATWEMLVSVWIPIAFNFEWVRRADNGDLLPSPEIAFGLTSENTLAEIEAALPGSAEVLKSLKEEIQNEFQVTLDYGADGLAGQNYCWAKKFDEFKTDTVTGRAVLPAEAFNPDSLQIDLPDEIYA